MNRNRLLYILMLIILGLVCIMFSPFVRGQTISYNTVVQFENGRDFTIQLVNKHLEVHKNCDLRKVVFYLEHSPILFDYRPNPLWKSWCYPDKYKGIWFNSNARINWDEKEIAAYLIHESFHLTKDCGEDIKETIRSKPVCKLFGNSQWSSYEITLAIEGHLWK